MIQIRGIFNGIRFWRERERERGRGFDARYVWLGGCCNSLYDYGNYTVSLMTTNCSNFFALPPIFFFFKKTTQPPLTTSPSTCFSSPEKKQKGYHLVPCFPKKKKKSRGISNARLLGLLGLWWGGRGGGDGKGERGERGVRLRFLHLTLFRRV